MDGRDGGEKGRPLGNRKQEREEKREEQSQQNEAETAAESKIFLHNGAAQRRDDRKKISQSFSQTFVGRVDWKRKGWPDAKFEGTSAKWDLRNEQQREKREESRERREKREESREG